MTQADSVHSTPPTNTSAVHSRRVFLTKAAGLAAGGAALVGGSAVAAAAASPNQALAATAEPLDSSKASPALRDAIIALRESHESLEAARARFVADDLKVAAWGEGNPRPTGRRGLKRWGRRRREYSDAVEMESWHGQLDADRHFRDAQLALAKVDARDMNDLLLKAAAAFIYDKEKMSSYGSVAMVSYSVTLDLMRLRMAGAVA